MGIRDTEQQMRRCESIGMMPIGDMSEWPRCALTANHDGEHEGEWRGRGLMWDSSPMTVGEESEEFWERVS